MWAQAWVERVDFKNLERLPSDLFLFCAKLRISPPELRNCLELVLRSGHATSYSAGSLKSTILPSRTSRIACLNDSGMSDCISGEACHAINVSNSDFRFCSINFTGASVFSG